MLGYVRQFRGERILVIANFSEAKQQLSANQLRLRGLGYQFRDLNAGIELRAEATLTLTAYQFLWLEAI
jgi:amylosucrase